MNFKKQKGAALLLLLTIATMAAAVIIASQLSANQQQLSRNQKTIEALHIAKNSLLGYSLKQTPPGRLPCPDTSGDGIANTSGMGCDSNVGQLPYKTLNIAQVTDGGATPLWYVVNDLAITGYLTTLNSLALGTTSVNGKTSIAGVIAANEAIDNQQRSTLTRNNYLEGTNETSTDTFANQGNDIVIAISDKEFWALIEKRVVREAKDLLTDYYSACGNYPEAATFGLTPLSSVSGLSSGHLPFNQALPTQWNTGCALGVTPEDWLVDHWGELLYFHACANNSDNCLQITGEKSAQIPLLVATPGVPLSGQNRTANSLTQFFESDNSDLDNTYTYSTFLNFSETFNDTLDF